MEVESIVKLTSRDFEDVVELGEETANAFFLILNGHAFDSDAHNVDGREREVASANRSFFAETVFKDACAASHSCYFIDVAMGVISVPFFVLIESSVEVDEVGEETTSGDFASLLVKIVVAVGGKVVYAAFLFPDLDRENGGSSVSDAFIGGLQEFANDATAFGGGVGAVVYRGENDLVSAARVDSVHVVDKGFHGLVNTSDSTVDGVLLSAFDAFKAIEGEFDVVVDGCIVERRIVFAGELFDAFNFFDI